MRPDVPRLSAAIAGPERIRIEINHGQPVRGRRVNLLRDICFMGTPSPSMKAATGPEPRSMLHYVLHPEIVNIPNERRLCATKTATRVSYQLEAGRLIAAGWRGNGKSKPKN